MKMPNGNHVLYNLLRVFTLMFLVTLEIGESNHAAYYVQISKTECLNNWLIGTQPARSLIECASSCMMTNMCGFFSYCKGTCKMHNSIDERPPYKSGCDCRSYLLLDRNDRNRVKIYELTNETFKNNPLDTFWDDWPVDKVKLFVIKNSTEILSLTFNAKNSSSTEWFNPTRLLTTPWFGNVTATYKFYDGGGFFSIKTSGGIYLLHGSIDSSITYEILYRMNINDTEERVADRLDVYAYS